MARFTLLEKAYKYFFKVFDDGSLAEFEPPADLLAKPDSIFRSLAETNGLTEKEWSEIFSVQADENYI